MKIETCFHTGRCKQMFSKALVEVKKKYSKALVEKSTLLLIAGGRCTVRAWSVGTTSKNRCTTYKPYNAQHTRHGGGRAWLENVIWLVKVQVGRDRVEQVGDCVG